jgi:hypothetical protein
MLIICGCSHHYHLSSEGATIVYAGIGYQPGLTAGKIYPTCGHLSNNSQTVAHGFSWLARATRGEMGNI